MEIPKLQFIKTFALLISYGFAMVTLSTWVAAYLNGGYITVTINQYNEMYPELVMWIILTPLLTWGAWIVFRDYMRYLHSREKIEII